MKTNISTILQLIGLILIGILFSACQPCDDPTDPECKNYDPCYNLGPVSADFQIIESLSNRSSLDLDLELENVTGKHVNIHPMKLISKDTGDIKHKWIIGRDPRIREGANEVVTFGGYTGSLTVTHIVEGPARTDCFPEDDGRDTAVYTVEIIRFEDDPPSATRVPFPIEGAFEGASIHDPSTQFTMRMEFINPVFVAVNSYFQLKNFPMGCTESDRILFAANGFVHWRGFVDPILENCLGAHYCVGQLLDGGDSLRIDYNYYSYESLADSNPDNDELLRSTFYGKRK